MTRAKLICVFCKEPIRTSREDYDHRIDIEGTNRARAIYGNDPRYGSTSQIESAWHTRCVPDRAEPDSPFQAAVLKAKQAIADARRLDPEAYESFVEIVGLALREQRETTPDHFEGNVAANIAGGRFDSRVEQHEDPSPTTSAD